MKKSLFILVLLVTVFAKAQSETNEIQQDSTKLQEIVLTATRATVQQPVTFTNIEAEQLESRNLGQDIPILLNFAPGVVTTSDAGAGIGYTGIRVRGSDASRVNVTINGVPYNDSESQGVFWVDLPDFSTSVDRYQLQRGVGTSTNGAGAFGASLNILTNGISEEPAVQVNNTVGSFNTRKHSVAVTTGLLNDHWEFTARLSQIFSDGFVDRASSDLDSYFLSAAYQGESTLIKALVFGGHEVTYQSWFGLDPATLAADRTFNPAGAYTDENGNTQFYKNQVDDYRQDHYQLIISEKFDSNWTGNATFHYTKGSGFYEEFKEDADYATYDLTPITVDGTVVNTTDLVSRRWLDNDFYGLVASLNYKKAKLDATFGGSYNQYNGDHYGEVIWARQANNNNRFNRFYFNEGNKTDYSAFAKATYRATNNWSFFGDLQIRGIQYEIDGEDFRNTALSVDDDHFFFNPKIGATYRIDSRDNLYVSIAKAQREPNRNDYENGNPVPEELVDYELGWRHTGEKFSINTNLYYMDYTNQLVLTGALDDQGSPLRENSGDSYRAGIEIEAAADLGGGFSLQPNLAYSINKNRDFIVSRNGNLEDLGNTDISYSPNLVASNILTYEFGNGFQASLLSKYVGEQYLGNTEAATSLLDSYFTNDVNLFYVWKPAKLVKEITFSFLVNNIFNTKYESNGYYGTFDFPDTGSPTGTTTGEFVGYYPQAGTNFLAGVNIKF